MSHERPKLITSADVPQSYPPVTGDSPENYKAWVTPRTEIAPSGISRESAVSYPDAETEQAQKIVYARPEMRNPDARDRGHIVGGWTEKNNNDGSVTLTHERFGDVTLGPDEIKDHEALQSIMASLPVETLGLYGEPLPAIELSQEETDRQGRQYVDAAVLEDKNLRVSKARSRVLRELQTLDATKPVPFNNPQEDLGMVVSDGRVVSYAEGARLASKEKRDARRRLGDKKLGGKALEAVSQQGLPEDKDPDSFAHLWNTGPEEPFNVERAAVREPVDPATKDRRRRDAMDAKYNEVMRSSGDPAAAQAAADRVWNSNNF